MPHRLAELGPVLLFCPGDRPERFAKAAAASDQVVLDLEDGVLPAAKDTAREAVVAYLRHAPVDAAVRINHPTTERGQQDAAAAFAAGGRLLVLPKTETRAEIETIFALSNADARLILSIETARGLLAVPELLSEPGVIAVSWGPYDLAADIGLRAVRDTNDQLLPVLQHARTQILLCAAAAKVAMLDTVTAELRDPALLQREASDAAICGMRGKFAIHPSQAALIREAFRPGQVEIDRARRLLTAAPAMGAFLFEGEMIDEPMLRRARHILALAG